MQKVVFRLQVDRIPAEIWITIFELACLANFNPFKNPSCVPDLQKTRNAITMTCPRWRDITVEMTSLWNNVGFLCTEPSRYSLIYNPIWTPINMSLPSARSKSRTLALFLDSESSPYTGRVFNAVIPHLHRCHSVSFILPNPRTFVKSFGGADLTFLQTLVLSWRNLYPSSSVHDINLSCAPRLRNLWLNTARQQTLNLRPPITMLSLTQLVIVCSCQSHIAAVGVLALIGSCPSLEGLQWSTPPADRGETHELDSDVRLTAPHLRYLHLAGCFVLSILRILDAPRVENLSLSLPTPDANTGYHGLVFGCPRFPELRYFEITGGSDIDVAAYIMAHGSLEEIVVHRDFEEHLLNLLANVHNTHPYLATARIRCRRKEKRRSAQEVRELFRHRQELGALGGTPPLQHLIVCILGYAPELQEPWKWEWEWGEVHDLLRLRMDATSLKREVLHSPTPTGVRWDWRLDVSYRSSHLSRFGSLPLTRMPMELFKCMLRPESTYYGSYPMTDILYEAPSVAKLSRRHSYDSF